MFSLIFSYFILFCYFLRRYHSAPLARGLPAPQDSLAFMQGYYADKVGGQGEGGGRVGRGVRGEGA